MSLLEINNLTVHFYQNEVITPLENISLKLNQNEIIGIVGESGSGKSVLCRSILRLYDEKYFVKYQGEILFEGEDILKFDNKTLRDFRTKNASMIFQNPDNSLNPLFKIGYQLSRAIILRKNISRKEANKEAVNLLAECGIPSPKLRMNNFPHQLSGGMKQRVMIAMALAKDSSLLIGDEPTTALDVTTELQILQLVKKIKDEKKNSVIWVSHDLGVVKNICDVITVLYAGDIVEIASTKDIMNNPHHPYTEGLLTANPNNISPNKVIPSIPGSLPSIKNRPSGCKFHPRCYRARELCKEQRPQMRIAKDRIVKCHFPIGVVE